MDEYILKKLNEIVISLGEITSYGTGLLAARENADCNSYPSDEIFDFNDCKGPTLEDVDDWWKEYTKQMNIEKEDVANHKEIEQNMMPQYKDGSFRPKNMNTGLLEYRYKDIDNKIISVYGLSKQECWNKRTKRLRETSELSSPDKLTLTVWLNEWYKTYKVPYNGEASLKEINRYIKQIANYFGDKISISDITTLQCQQFINKYSNKPNTQNKIYDVLNSALDKYTQLGYLDRNPAAMLTLTPHKAKHYRALEYSEQQRIYEACEEPYKQLYFFLCCTGIRVGKALELTVDCIDWDRKELRIIKKQKKGLTEEYRVSFLPSLFDTIKLPKNGLIFKISSDRLRKYFAELYDKLGIKNATIHSFRHTFVSTLYALGVSAKRIQTLAGHATIDMTLNTYTHLLDKGNSVIREYLQQLSLLF